MTEPRSNPREQSPDPTLQTEAQTEVMRGVRQIESLERGYVAPPEAVPSEPVYVKEPLFSKKVLFGWGIATLMVWFAFSFIVPAVVQSVKAAIETSAGTPGRNTRTEIRTPDGGVVTITRTESGVTIDRKGPGEVPVTAPGSPVPAAAPTPEAVVAPPAPPAAAPTPTGKK